ncbi:serine/threonine-protein kinase PAK 3-like isoform X2 [Tachypleus tridentatus]|uniref:serine/threonine-protein kinase PAK 3-like isoform X2 n=1 Tax=Tachypleus tridentatus TaxID=6853 RepID=UPI003FD5535C
MFNISNIFPFSHLPRNKENRVTTAGNKATETGTGLKVAVKQIYLTWQPNTEELITELQVLCEMKHPNIVNYLHSYLELNSLSTSTGTDSLAALYRKTPNQPTNQPTNH